jgi:NAD(P)-dependent dehydrogenase (short-subunit alcohol dehydrogenase family)
MRALVTGGTNGLGRAIADRFLADGGRVVITGRDESVGKTAAKELSTHEDRVCFVRADARHEDQVANSVSEAVGWLGGLDVLVNNAGIGVSATTLKTPVEDFDKVMAVNVRGYFLYAKQCFPHLVRSGGCMIHIASDAAILGESQVGVYSISKAAVVMMSNMLALECGPKGVRSNCLCPGDIVPGMRHMAAPGEEDGHEDVADWKIPPVGRLGEATDVASAAAFLASPGSVFCNGSVLLVDGGMRAGYNAGRPQS